MKDVIIESEMCVFHGLRQQGAGGHEAFGKHLRYVVEFIKFINQPAYSPSPDLLRNSLLLLGDILQFSGGSCKGVLTNQTLKELTGLLTQLSNDKATQSCIGYVHRYAYHLA
jgi:hypothetical protein